MKKKIALIITASVAVIAIVATVVVAAFINAPATKKKIVRKKVVVVTDPVQNDDDFQNTDNNFANDDFQNDTNVNNFNSNYQDDGLADGFFYVLRKITGADIGKNYYVVTLKNEHPGVVGYDADYEVLVHNKMGHLISNEDLIITVNNNKVKNNNGKLTVPYSVRVGNEKLVVSVKNKLAENLTGEYVFDFTQFTEKATFKDDFDKLDTDMWVYQKTDDKESDKVSVKDGCMELKSESANGNTYLSSAFTQAYGCFSARVKMHEKGLANFSFSLLTNQRYIKNEDLVIESGGEITAVEYFPYWKEKWSSCVRWFGWNSYTKKSLNDDLICKDIADSFHTYSVVWTPDTIFWYLDGKLVNSYSGEGVGKGSSAMNLCLKLTSYDKDNYRGGPFEPEAFPFTVKVDYIEAYGLIEK